ncbi:MAG: caspase family protein [Bacteroidota bacterium]
MKRFLFLLFVLLNILATAQNQPRKIALIIAISDYPEYSGWAKLSCFKDVEFIKPALEHQGFNQIEILTDSDATHTGIVNAMKKMTMYSRPGDIVYIHYSGHGQQIFDDNGDEPDGLDEAFVAYGAPSDYYEGYKGEKHLRDDEFGQLIYDIRLKLGKTGSMLVVADACHSGTMSRGIGKKRGGKAPMIPPGYKVNSSTQNGSGLMAAELKTRGQGVSPSPMVLYSASSFDEENSETLDEKGDGIGSLSFAVTKALSKCGKDYSYRSLFADVLSIMNDKVPQQTPMIEGDQDISLFGGKYIKQQPYLTLKEIKENKITINGGTLIGMNEDTKVAIYPAGTLNTANIEPLAKGEISNAGPYHSTIKLENQISLKSAADYWVFVTEPAIGKVNIKYRFGAIKNEEFKQQLELEIGKNEMAKSDLKSPDIILFEQDNFVKMMRSNDGVVIDSIQSAKSVDLINISLRAYAQNKYLRDLNSGYANEVNLKVVPCDENGNHLKAENMESVIEFKDGSYAKVKVFNKSNERLYFNVIDIQPDGKINPIVPASQELTMKHAEQYFIEPNSEKEIPFALKISPPYGNEVFKVFASNEPFNLTPFILNNGMQTRGGSGMVSNAFKKSEVQSRGATAKKVDKQELHTSEIIFKIVK